MSLKDKVMKWYPNRGIATALDKPHYFEEDVKEAVNELKSTLIKYREDEIHLDDIIAEINDILGEFE